MTYPTKPLTAYSFTNYQAANPTGPLPGNELDADLAEHKASIDAAIDFIKIALRSDGNLNNGIVRPESLGSGTLALISAGGGTWSGKWATATAYVVNDIVTEGSRTYICIVAHTSGTFTTDLAAGKWQMVDGGYARYLLPWFGAVGDGVTDDTAAVNAAIASGLPFSGLQEHVYAVTGVVNLLYGTSMWDVALKQLAPGASLSVITLRGVGVDNLDLRRVSVDRNGDGTNGGLLNASGTNGALNTAFGMYFSGGTNHHFEDLLVFGDDSGTGIKFDGLDETSRIIRPVVRDMTWARTAASDDQGQGIWFNACAGLVVENPTIGNLTGILNGVATPRFTRGLPVGGCSDMRFVAPTVYDCDQGVDITGGPAINADLRIISPYVRNCYIWGVKLSNSAQRCVVSGGVADGCGVGYVTLGNDALAAGETTDRNTFVDCVALDSGASGQAVVTVAGFRVLSGVATEKSAGARTLFLRCRAVDTQTVPTMLYGFATETPSPAVAYSPMMIDCESIGHVTAASGGAFISHTNAVGEVSQSGGYVTGAIVERGATANGSYVRFADGTQICWFTVIDTAAAWTDNATFGAAFFARATTAYVEWTFPVPFQDVPVVQAIANVLGVDSICGTTNRAVTQVQAFIAPWCSQSKAAGVVKSVSMTAVGRWF